MSVLDYISVITPAVFVTATAFDWILKLSTKITKQQEIIKAMQENIVKIEEKTEKQDEKIQAAELGLAKAEIKAEIKDRD